ncbi:MAG: E3 ubiquitin-protein ligase RGLG1 [Edafosvirus sp.]|uniref:E3 ubiquitin-protein ligase RGLG1 n=1 Tax=Edafosvirus sp. TaxID=2487765 RepID=A0A3G4ZTW9_9VIRU|nr:MAG: E3 ubiquitin-protein ligase RGLG1 [Edafosvirus sp.]
MGLTTTKEENSHKQSITINDSYKSFGEVQEALRSAGLENSNLIVGVDFTKSNTWQGKKSFHGYNLHALLEGSEMNQYQYVISTIGKTLTAFDNDNLIPAYGFGDVVTENHSVFSFKDNDIPCRGFDEVLSKYNEIAQKVQLSGTTSFAPIIRKAIEIVKKEGSYHILLIIADGVIDVESDVKDTVDAIMEATKYPLSIITIGVGDGPWKLMEEFDDELPKRSWDNFQFVDFNKVMHKEVSDPLKFALHALMEIPEQYRIIKKKGLIKSKRIY